MPVLQLRRELIAEADRARFAAWLVFLVAWVTLVYVPIAHWVFNPDGWIAANLRVLDLAGGTVVEINSGMSALALALVLRPRLGFRADPMRPHNMPLVVLGAGLLWFGWFGFNAGSAITAGGAAGMAFLNTQVAAASAVGSSCMSANRRASWAARCSSRAPSRWHQTRVTECFSITFRASRG